MATRPYSLRAIRRTVGALLACTLALTPVWATTASVGTAASSDVDKAGVLKLGADLATLGGIRFDPETVASPNDWYYQQWIYDSLLRQNADGSYSPGLAKSA